MRQLFKDKNFLRLCLATFFMSSCLQLIWVVMPFIVKSMNGSDTDVGLCFMGQMGVYVIFCIMAGMIVDRLKPKKVLLISTAVQIAIMCGMFAVVRSGGRILVSPTMQLVFLMSMTGVITAFFWPVMMGWISTGHEGAALTRRLGFYNVTWGMANMIFPIIGGYLMEINYLSSIAAGVVMVVLCLAAVSIIKPPNEMLRKTTDEENGIITEELNPQNRQFIWMSRLALFATFMCIGIFRSQLGIFYKYEIGFAESIYGWSVSLMCLFNVVIFYLMGRSHWWHYKKGMFAASQVLLIICMAMIIFSRSLFVQLLASGLTGISYSVVYGSHQYYGVSGGRRRSGLMAVHETVLGAGYAIGSIVGGLISDNFGRQWPYVFGCGAVAAAGFIQIFLWFAAGKYNQLSSKAKTSFLTSPM